MFEFFNVPSREIDRSLEWLLSMREDIDDRIRYLESVKANRDRQNEWKDRLNRIAEQFDDPGFLQLAQKQKMQILFQRYDLSYSRAEYLLDKIPKVIKRKEAAKRKARIVHMHKSGVPVSEIAKAESISRQACYKILQAEKGLF